MGEQIAVVTGAGSGIGAATAALLAQRGYQVVGLDRNGAGLAALVSPPGAVAGVAGIRTAVCDVADEEQLDQALASLVGVGQPVTVAVAAAGISFNGPLAETTPERFDEVHRVNLRGVFLLARALAPRLEAASGRGSFVAVASELGTVGLPGLTAYSSAKAGVINMMRVLALEYAARGVRFNAMAPGGTETPMLVADVQASGRTTADVAAGNPMRRLGRPDEIAEAIAFLASGAASFITGTTLIADGGYTAR
jgi:NAD(P)-dependent dehydrogenase (short-subunit alcohol dehydrogenase family)